MISLRQLFLLNNAQTSSTPRLLEIERAEGIYLFGPSGKAYMDLVSGFAVSNVGHCHPAVVKAVKDQAERYMHVAVYGEYVQSPQVLYAEKLISVLPAALNSVYFVNSGAEATEGALKLAKRFTGRSKIVSCYQAYHGSTHGALSVMGNEYYKQAYRPLLPNVHFIHFNESADLDLIDHDTACVIVESIQGEAGVRVPENAYMQALRKRCDETGALLIMDEIQTGFGRTGKLFAFEHFGIHPDILLLAKGIGGGMPIGAFIASREIMDCLKDNPILGHITTFGGHPVSCAAGLATLNTILEENMVAEVGKKEALFRTLLSKPPIREVRGMGLMLCIQIDTFAQVEAVSKKCLEEGIIVDWFLHCDTALRIAPPLTITEPEIREACRIITETVAAIV
ncbi:acetylornithine/succinyldiaminopimelate/putrescine aminotransferase [Arcticibacter tournemirensis]|uniref:Aspartate aminotransferase family protein n=1 Tax=Arcticibacter tournemirensis TaxID=699437 RepID=A0A5M9H7J7_9SPHI|nr:aspartate aminotransferase family protein [Arcticibacter tournemirensis]KAA8482269.1 aspartate aminotransferase family protein [Arcticibacter tournemirensis]TQM52409.1 acetylornithine/succinyldiaminopimelate/putrescine aminotransferase [Arcticibacter tournemirensis]